MEVDWFYKTCLNSIILILNDWMKQVEKSIGINDVRSFPDNTRILIEIFRKANK